MKLKNVISDANRHTFNSTFFFKTLGCTLLFALIIFGVTLVTSIISGILGSITPILSFVGFIALIAICILIAPMSYGLIAVIMKLYRNEPVSLLSFVSIGKENFKKIWGIWLRIFVKLLLPIILLLVLSIATMFFAMSNYTVTLQPTSQSSGNIIFLFIVTILQLAVMIYYIVKVLSFSLTNYVFVDCPDLNSSEIIARSEELMKGNKFKYILLILYVYLITFILVFIAGLLSKIPVLAFILMAIVYLFLLVYIYALCVSFYENIIEENEDTAALNNENE